MSQSIAKFISKTVFDEVEYLKVANCLTHGTRLYNMSKIVG